MSSTNTHPRYSKFERHFSASAADQRQQADIVAVRVQASSSGSLSRDETALLTARLSEIAVDQQHQEATEESSSQIVAFREERTFIIIKENKLSLFL